MKTTKNTWAKNICEAKCFNSFDHLEAEAVLETFLRESREDWLRLLPERKEFIATQIQNGLSVDDGMKYFLGSVGLELGGTLQLFGEFTKQADPLVIWDTIKDFFNSWDFFDYAKEFKSFLSPETIDPNYVFGKFLTGDYEEAQLNKDELAEVFTACKGFNKENLNLI